MVNAGDVEDVQANANLRLIGLSTRRPSLLEIKHKMKTSPEEMNASYSHHGHHGHKSMKTEVSTVGAVFVTFEKKSKPVAPRPSCYMGL